MRQLISQSKAARVRDISRQRISELIKLGRLQLARDDKGELLGGLWLDEVLNLDLKSVGRPRLSDEERMSRIGKFQAGDRVVWLHTPKESYGYVLPIVAEVVKVSTKRLKLAFDSDAGSIVTWASQDQCKLQSEFASDNEETHEVQEIPDSGKNVVTKYI